MDETETEPMDGGDEGLMEGAEGVGEGGGGLDQVTDVEEDGLGARCEESCQKFVLGPVLLLISIVVLFWNEGRTVKRVKDLNHALGEVLELGDIAKVDGATDGAVIHATGQALAVDLLSDPIFGVAESALKLERSVETYQWVERKSTTKRKKRGGGTRTVTTYSYNRQWRAGVSDSSRFRSRYGHENPPHALFDPLQMEASTVAFGAFLLPPDMVARMDYYSPVTDLSLDTLPNSTGVTVTDGSPPYFLFGSGSLQNPSVGDTRVSFSMVPSNLTISIIAEQIGNTFQALTTAGGGQVLLVEQGAVPAGDMIQNAKNENRLIAWLIRLLGAVGLFMGGKFLLDPLVAFADILPLLGDIVDIGVSLVAAIAAIAIWVTVVSIAWLFYRPLIGGLVLLVLIIVIGTTVWCLRQNRRTRRAGGVREREALLPPEAKADAAVPAQGHLVV